MLKKTYLFILFLPSFICSQNPFFLEDINPNSETYGQLIGPSLYDGDVSVIFFGHET